MLDSILTFLNSSIVGLTVSDVFIISLFVLSLVLTVVSSVVILTAKVKKIDLEVEKTKNNQAVTEKIIQNRLDSILDKLNSEVFLEKTSCIAKDIDVDMLKNNYIKQNINFSDNEEQDKATVITAPSKSNLSEEVINQVFEKAENIPLVQENIAIPYKEEEEKVVVNQSAVTTTTVTPEEKIDAVSSIYASVPRVDNVSSNNGELSALINKYSPSNNTYGVHDSNTINSEAGSNHTLVDYNLPENQNLYSNTFDYRDYLPKNTEKPNDYTAIINKYSHSNKNQISKFNFNSSNTDFSKYSAKGVNDFSNNYKPYVPYTPVVAPTTNKLAYTPSSSNIGNDFSSSSKHITFENKFSNKNYSDVFKNEKNKPSTSVFKPFSRSNNLENSFTAPKEKPAIPFMQSKKNAPKNNFLERNHNADRDNSGFKIAPISSPKKNNVVISSKPHTIHPVAAEIIPAQKTHLKKTSLISTPMPSQINDGNSFYSKNSFKHSSSSIKINDFKYPIN